jgi:hypothetical protein
MHLILLLQIILCFKKLRDYLKLNQLGFDTESGVIN